MTNEEMIKDIDEQIEELKREKERLEKERENNTSPSFPFPFLTTGIICPIRPASSSSIYSEILKILREIEKLEEMKKNYGEGNE